MTGNPRNGRSQRQLRISERQAMQLRRAAIQTLRECDAVLGYETIIKRVAMGDEDRDDASQEMS